MPQVLFGSDQSPNNGDLDNNFTELYNRWSRATFSGTNLAALKVNTDTVGYGQLLAEAGNAWAIEARITASGGVAYRATYTAASGSFTVGYFTYNGTLVGSIASTSTATSYNTTSDERLKKDIADAPASGAVIDAMKVRSFTWRASGERVTHGFIAQELHQVAPDAVTVGDDDKVPYWSGDWSKLVPLMVKELQDLRRRVADLEAA